MENIDISVASGLLVPDASEDSVDIYDGLDIGPSSKSPEKSPRNGSQLRDSMDLYEEIVAEEQQSRESSYNELKSRFQAAQDQIKALHRRLEQLEVQNTGLSTENHCLKKNISALLRTARQEVTRKDAEIQRLNQWSEKGRHHHQSHLNNVRDPNSSSRTSTINSTSKPRPPPSHNLLPPPPLPPPPPPPPVSSPPPPPLPSQPTSPPGGNQPPKDPPQPPKDPPQPPRKASDHLTRSSKASSHSHSKRDCEVADKQTESDKLRSRHREEKHQSQKPSESTDRRHRSCSDSNKDCQAPDKSRSHRTDKKPGRRYESRSCKSKDSVNVEGHHRSSDSKDRKKSSSSQHTERYSDSSKERERDRQRDYQRKGNRQREDESSRKHRRSSQSETSREREKQRSKESDKGKVDICGKERREKTHEAQKRSSEELNVGEKSSVEENSPNRKLCFMEKLNLTLSPIKKPVLAFDGSQNDLPSVDKDVEKTSAEENLQPNVEDMCVIDEVVSSELEVLEGVVEKSPDNLKASSSEKMHKRSDVKDVQKKDKRLSESPAADNLVQTTSAHREPLDTAKNQNTVHLAPKSPESCSLKAADISKNYKDKTKMVSDSQVADWEPLENTDGTDPSEMSGGISEQNTSNDLQKADPGKPTDLSAAVTQPTVLNSSVQPPKTAVPQCISLDSLTEDAVSSQPRETNVDEDITDKANSESQQVSPVVSASTSSVIENDGCGRQDCPKDTDAVSSTISLESLPQEGLSLSEAIYVLTQNNEDANDCSDIANEPSSSTSCIGVSKVSSTTEEKMLPERYSEFIVTPKKTFSPGKGQEKKVEPSSSVPLLHDEDSMMRTLSNLKRIPDVISPLKSPVRISKRNLPHVHGKPGHVKSLQKDFSSTPVDGSLKKLDVNKENKYPGSPANCDTPNQVDKVSDLSSSLSGTDLEEGEILSESDESPATSPVSPTKRAKVAQPVGNKPSQKSVLKRKSEERLVSKETHETAGASTRSPKSRFKTVCPAASKASFSTVEEIMETFKLVRTEIRKKYMKLHKTFPKKSFYGVMDNFRESFLEFVEGAYFGDICSQAEELKSMLKKLIESVFGKVSNNGIVKRIFEQQAVDLKQKLWDFVDVQVDYLFRDIQSTLKSHCKPARAQAEGKKPSRNERESRQTSLKKPQCQQTEAQAAPNSLNPTKSCVVAPYKTGLGSRGKDIRITYMEKDGNADSHPSNCPNTKTVVEFLPPKNLPMTPDKNNKSLVISQNGPMLDKTDFELLTEQQASSLTFNLVRDSQMGEIFKCLLQGSDLLESSSITGDNTAWSLSTPRKDRERFITITTPSKFDSPSKLISPTKFDTPSKLITTWSSISPRKMSSPRLKDEIPLNPAFFDESCLLEVPQENRTPLQASLAAQKTYSILAEDLAVSLTIPSPLKSESHLSFLQPSTMSMQIMSTPDSVISAHISEDAMLDGEDATEQDIHLALDTDNSTCGSSSSTASEPLATPFVFKPDVPMQALVMEKSNDHFIVKIRQANTSADITLTADDSFSRTLIEDDQQQMSDVCHIVDEGLTLTNKKQDMSVQPNTSKDCLSNGPSKNLPEDAPFDNSLNNGCQKSAAASDEGTTHTHVKEEHKPPKTPTKALSCKSPKRIRPSKCAVSDKSLPHPAESSDTNQHSRASRSHISDSEREEMDVSESERSLTIAEDTSSSPEKQQRDCNNGRKRKRHQEKSKAKRSRKAEKESTEEMASSLKEVDEEQVWSSPTACVSPNSLSAKNVIRKKGEVVITWTRDEDRAILMELKTKGASRETFSALSEKLNKPSEQIAHRFYQLMKLFKKQEKKDT
ncbi:CASP8-associated protein 2 isoform X2 [Amphiprion ocellaris]|nr:CASP8-associated protein 2 isoform X2 [Amphiprion ocellaris]